MMTTRLTRPLLGALVATACLLGAPQAGAGVLLGTGTYSVVDDLTLIDDGGSVLEFLDLTFTVNDTPANAVATYGADGFRFANHLEITALLGAFNTTFAFVPTTYVDLGAAASDMADFVSYLGATLTVNVNNASLGWFDASALGGNPNTYLCMSNPGCGPSSFVNNQLDPPNPIVGVFLVRDGAVAAPEPSVLLLAGIGFAALGATARNRRRR